MRVCETEENAPLPRVARMIVRGRENAIALSRVAPQVIPVPAKNDFVRAGFLF